MSTPLVKTGRLQRELETALRARWRCWTTIIEMFAQGSGPRRQLDAAEFRALHSELLSLCHALGDGADEGERASLQRLEDLVGPWLTLDILERADREILADLMARCQAAEQALGGPGWQAWLRAWVGPALIILVIVGVCSAAGWFYPQWGPTVVDWWTDSMRAIRLAFRDIKTEYLMASGTLAAAVVAGFLFLRLTRR